MSYESREDVFDKIDWEGGYESVLEYGLHATDMPKDDHGLHNAWMELEDAYRVYAEKRQVVEDLLDEQ